MDVSNKTVNAELLQNSSDSVVWSLLEMSTSGWIFLYKEHGSF